MIDSSRHGGFCHIGRDVTQYIQSTPQRDLCISRSREQWFQDIQ